MNSPNETPSFGKEAMPMLVGWGSQMLPGPVVCEPVRQKLYWKRNMILTLVRPSIKMTAMSKKEDTIPSIDAMESNESGKNTAGKNLVKRLSVSHPHRRKTRRTQSGQEFYKS